MATDDDDLERLRRSNASRWETVEDLHEKVNHQITSSVVIDKGDETVESATLRNALSLQVEIDLLRSPVSSSTVAAQHDHHVQYPHYASDEQDDDFSRELVDSYDELRHTIAVLDQRIERETQRWNAIQHVMAQHVEVHSALESMPDNHYQHSEIQNIDIGKDQHYSSCDVSDSNCCDTKDYEQQQQASTRDDVIRFENKWIRDELSYLADALSLQTRTAMLTSSPLEMEEDQVVIPNTHVEEEEDQVFIPNTRKRRQSPPEEKKHDTSLTRAKQAYRRHGTREIKVGMDDDDHDGNGKKFWDLNRLVLELVERSLASPLDPFLFFPSLPIDPQHMAFLKKCNVLQVHKDNHELICLAPHPAGG